MIKRTIFKKGGDMEKEEQKLGVQKEPEKAKVEPPKSEQSQPIEPLKPKISKIDDLIKVVSKQNRSAEYEKQIKVSGVKTEYQEAFKYDLENGKAVDFKTLKETAPYLFHQETNNYNDLSRITPVTDADTKSNNLAEQVKIARNKLTI